MDRHIKDILQNLVKEPSLSEGYRTNKVQQFWQQKMPPSIADRTSEIKVQNQTLYLKITSAALKNELFNSREKIIDLVNEFLGETAIIKVVLL